MSLPLDIWSEVAKHIITNEDKCRLMLTCKEISNCVFYFEEVMNIKKIIKSHWFHHFINIVAFEEVDELPRMTKYLVLGDSYNQYISRLIPQYVTHLTFSNYYDYPIDGCIPGSVTHLIFGTYFNQPINGSIPSSVTHLTFGNRFNNIIKNLPNSIVHLTFGNYFNKPVDFIPPSVTHLIFGQYFNQPIKNCIPPSVEYIHFGTIFNQPLEDLPLTVSKISFKILGSNRLDYFTSIKRKDLQISFS